MRGSSGSSSLVYNNNAFLASCLLLVALATTGHGLSNPSQFSSLKRNRIPIRNGPRRLDLKIVNARMEQLRAAQGGETTTTESDSSGIQQQQQQKQPEQQNFTVGFPSLSELQTIPRGEFVASDVFEVLVDKEDNNNDILKFRLLLYPRGGGQSMAATKKQQQETKKDSNNNNNLLSFLPTNDDPKNDRLGVYLQYLPQNEDDTVDATFSLRLKGKQKSGGPRFDVEWSTGIRFVAPDRGNLRDGTGNDFGAHLMQSAMLPLFLGEDNGETLQAEVNIKIHDHKTAASTQNDNNVVDENNNNNNNKREGGFLSFNDIRSTGNPNEHDTENVRVGKIIVPILQKLSQRPRLFQIGAYPGVEYRIMRILHPETGEEIFSSVPGADYELRPIYPLVRALERSWPVRVNEAELPKLYTMIQYNTVSALGSLFTAVTGLVTAFIISQLVSFFFIPSKSMDPTLRVGDVLLVEKVTPRLLKNPNIGDVVLFNPNDKLMGIVKSSGGRITDRDLFVKRVAAGPGDSVSVDAVGTVSVNGKSTGSRRDLCEEEPLKLIQKFIQPVTDEPIGKDEVFVMGDCSSVSVDSRVWGPLNNQDIVGRPIIRIWPLERWGRVPSLPEVQESSFAKASLVTEWTD